MYMKTFLIILKYCLSKKYPDVVVDFYISRRSKFVDMSLLVLLQKIDLSGEIISFIESQWKEQNNTKFFIVQPYLINSVKWKFDIIFEKNFSSDKDGNKI